MIRNDNIGLCGHIGDLISIETIVFTYNFYPVATDTKMTKFDIFLRNVIEITKFLI